MMRFIIKSLLEKSNDERRIGWAHSLLQKLPNSELFQSINGRDKLETEAEMCDMGIRYRNIVFKNYGKIACWLTKLKGFKAQVGRRIPVVCWLEDDIEPLDGFLEFALQAADRLPPDKDILRMSPWGECHITTLAGAQRLVERLTRDGIRMNSDDQLRSYPEVYLQGLPYRLLSPTNFGETLRGAHLSSEDEQRLKASP